MDRDVDGNSDFYADSSDGLGRSKITRPLLDFTRTDLPKPWFSWLPGVRSLKARTQKRYEMEVAAVEQIVERRLDSTELDAMAYWTCKDVQVRSRGFPIGFLLGSYRAYKTHDEFRFPFWKPSERFNPNVIKVFGQTLLEGQLPRIFWHTLRYSAYTLFVGPLVAVTFTGSWAISVASVGRQRDPRLKGLYENIRTRAQQRMQQMRPNIGTVQPLQSSPAANYDPNSPTSNEYGDTFPSDSDPYSSQTAQDSSNFAAINGPASGSGTVDSYMPTRSNERPTAREHANTRPKQEQSRMNNESSSFFDNNYDDASPTADYPSPSSSGGSAWDRIRAGRNVDTTLKSPKERANRNVQTGPPASAETDPRSQAQKDFDASLERERQGRNF